MNVAARTTSEINVSDQRRVISRATWERSQIALSGVLLIIGSLVVFYALYLALSWYSRPFPGIMFTSQMVVNDVTPMGGEQWTGLQAGLKPDDRILKIDDITLTDKSDPAS